MRRAHVESVSRADDEILAGWIAACAARPGSLPDGVELVRARLVRSVGRGRLPDAGEVHVKSMGFPRARDRLRYCHRALPAVHEARMLDRVAAAGIPCPDVVLAVGRRWCGLPRWSLLVTRTLVHGGEVGFADAADVAARLAAAGVFHPDLQRDNFLRLASGAVAVLDLQSARWRPPRLSDRLRLRMAAKLVADFDALASVTELARVGLVAERWLGEVEAGVGRLRARDMQRRVMRCLTTSTDFVVERRWGGTLHRRRDADLGRGRWLRRCDARALWIGDRVLEVFDGRPPVLGALFRRWWWLPGASSVHVIADEDLGSASAAGRLTAAFARFRDTVRSA